MKSHRLPIFIIALLLGHASVAGQVAPAPRPAAQDLQKDVADIADDAKWWAAYKSLQGRAERGQHRAVMQALADAYRDDTGEPCRRMQMMVRQFHLVAGEKARRAEASEQVTLIEAAVAELAAASDSDTRGRASAAATRALAALKQVLQAPEKPLVLPVNPPAGKQPDEPPALGGGQGRVIRTKDGKDVVVTPPEDWGDDELEAEFKDGGVILKRKQKAATQPAPKPKPKQGEESEGNDAGAGETAKDPIAEALACARPTAEEEAWRLIPWRDSLGAAIEQATREAKPVFFFGIDGVLDTGQC